MASVASARGPCRMAYTFSFAIVRFEMVKLYFWVANLRFCSLKMASRLRERLEYRKLMTRLEIVQVLLFNRLINQSVDFMAIGSEDIVLTAGEVCMHLAR